MPVGRQTGLEANGGRFGESDSRGSADDPMKAATEVAHGFDPALGVEDLDGSVDVSELSRLPGAIASRILLTDRIESISSGWERTISSLHFQYATLPRCSTSRSRAASRVRAWLWPRVRRRKRNVRSLSQTA